MKRVSILLAALFVIAGPCVFAAPPRFEKVSDHFYYFRAKDDGTNVGAVVTDDGVLLVNPPAEPELTVVLGALKRVSPRPVRWVVSTDYRIARSGDVANWAEQGTTVLGSEELWKLMSSAAEAEAKNAPVAQADNKPSKPPESHGKVPLIRFAFEGQIFLYPGGVEIRIFALRHRAHSGSDVVVCLPGEKVIQAGDLFVSGSYPEIDKTPGGGDAVEWIDGLKQVIDAMPLMKPAIPQPKSESGKTPAGEKSSMGMVTVIPGHGPASDIQEMKNLLEISHKLRAEVAKAVAAGAKREKLLGLPGLAPFQTYGNFETYATQLFDALSNK